MHLDFKYNRIPFNIWGIAPLLVDHTIKCYQKTQMSLLCVIVILKATFVLLQQIYSQGSDNSVTGESGLF